MLRKEDIIEAAKENPTELRDLLKDSDVDQALNLVGILPKILELHAPSSNSLKDSGLGKTLCGIKGTRHQKVTCIKCNAAVERGLK